MLKKIFIFLIVLFSFSFCQKTFAYSYSLDTGNINNPNNYIGVGWTDQQVNKQSFRAASSSMSGIAISGSAGTVMDIYICHGHAGCEDFGCDNPSQFVASTTVAADYGEKVNGRNYAFYRFPSPISLTVGDEYFYSISGPGGNGITSLTQNNQYPDGEGCFCRRDGGTGFCGSSASLANVDYNFFIFSTIADKPVIIVPGIMGSYLNRESDGEEIWVSWEKLLLPGDDNYLDELAMDTNGNSINQIYSSDILRKILLPTPLIKDLDYFEGLINELKNSGYIENKNLFVFPYDWRKDINLIALKNNVRTNTLEDEIETVLRITGAKKVDIIAHSMGGLVVKKYMSERGTSTIDKFVDIATPHLGAPKAFNNLMYGDVDFKSLNINRSKFISQNMPSAYQLLPSQKYQQISDSDYQYYIADMADIDNNGIKGNLDFNASKEFMANTGRNSYLLNTKDNLHNDIDDFSYENSYNIIGCGKPTIGKTYILNKEKSGEYEYALKYINGDGTVPLKSAEAMPSKFVAYSSQEEHPYISSANGVRQLISYILSDEEQNFDFSPYSSLSQGQSVCALSGMQISFHSPIDLHIYDGAGNHVGPDVNGDVEIGILGASYDIIENNKFAFIPTGVNFIIIGKATSTGSFNARIEKIENGVYTQIAYFNEVSLASASTTIRIEMLATTTMENIIMSEDQAGDGVFESATQPDSILDEQESQDYEKPTTTINVIGVQDESGNYIQEATIELTTKDNTGGSGILKTEYSLDNGQTWIKYDSEFKINTEGTTTIQYSSTDRAGSREETKEKTIIITNKKEITIETTIQDIIDLYNQDKINRFAKDGLIRDLQNIQSYIERHGKRQEERDDRYDNAMAKCEKTKPQEWCEKKVGGIYNKITYVLSAVRKKIIITQFNTSLLKIRLYKNLNWINSEAYDIIKNK
ncbi:MAG: hypothetical protein ABH881_01970 [bacterium]